MKALSSHPLIYEINTWVWLNELSHRFDRPITLGNVPTSVWDDLSGLKIDVVWMMGVWERSPHGIRLALQNAGLIADFRHALPDFTPQDVVGSPYCVRRYQVDLNLGGPQGLAAARQALAERGIRLILDYVPNHVAPDHPWINDHPEYFIQGTPEDLSHDPQSFFRSGSAIIAHGKDPNFPAWPDVAQLNAFHPGLREAVEDTLLTIASQCDGLRCDMAMLMFNRIFGSTWGERAGSRPKDEFWPALIQSVRLAHPDFLWIAEAYWDTEPELIEQGFDYCYDKVTYDLIKAVKPFQLKAHLEKMAPISDHLIRFIENHDEARATSAFDPDRLPLAAYLTSTLPGGVIFHEGQFEGRQTRLPVFLGRRPSEAPNSETRFFYQQLLDLLTNARLDTGNWNTLPLELSSDASSESILAWHWHTSTENLVVMGNLSARPVKASVQLPFEPTLLNIYDIPSSTPISPSRMVTIDLAPWQTRLLSTTPQPD